MSESSENLNKSENPLILVNGLDTEKGMASAGGNLKTYLNLLSTFHMDGASKINEIKTYIETGNIKSYTINVHALKSACANIGASELSEAAAALEMAGKKGDLSFIRDNNAAFVSNLETILNNINIALMEEAKEGKKNHIDRNLLKTELSNLKTALVDFDYFKIEDSVTNLQDFTQDADVGDTVKAILKKILNGEYEEAISMTDALINFSQ